MGNVIDGEVAGPVVVTMPVPEGSNAVIESEADDPRDLNFLDRKVLRQVMIRALLLPDEIFARRKRH